MSLPFVEHTNALVILTDQTVLTSRWSNESIGLCAAAESRKRISRGRGTPAWPRWRHACIGGYMSGYTHRMIGCKLRAGSGNQSLHSRFDPSQLENCHFSKGSDRCGITHGQHWTNSNFHRPNAHASIACYPPCHKCTK